jgi:membrane fusion protein (multidrug efflux system)
MTEGVSARAGSGTKFGRCAGGGAKPGHCAGIVAKLGLGAGVLPLFVALVACSPEAAQQAVEFRVPVAVEEVGVATIEDRIVTTGTLRTREIVTLSVVDTGRLEILEGAQGRLGEGDLVRAGDEVARIVGEDVRLAARIVAVRRAFEAAETDLEAHQALVAQGLINQSVLDSKESAYENAKIDLERARYTEDRNRLITPIDGVILKLARDSEAQLMANGQLVNPGQVVAQIAPLDPLIADVDLVGDDIADVRVGLEARARYHAFGEVLFAGEVIRLAPTVDQRTRALRAEVEIDNAEGRLRPGMFVEVTLVGERREDVPVIPRRALTERGGQRVIFVLRGQRVEQQQVTLGLGDDEFVEVIDGVLPGERVVVRGLETLTDQMFVRVTGG